MRKPAVAGMFYPGTAEQALLINSIRRTALSRAPLAKTNVSEPLFPMQGGFIRASGAKTLSQIEEQDMSLF